MLLTLLQNLGAIPPEPPIIIHGQVSSGGGTGGKGTKKRKAGVFGREHPFHAASIGDAVSTPIAPDLEQEFRPRVRHRGSVHIYRPIRQVTMPEPVAALVSDITIESVRAAVEAAKVAEVQARAAISKARKGPPSEDEFDPEILMQGALLAFELLDDEKQ